MEFGLPTSPTLSDHNDPIVLSKMVPLRPHSKQASVMTGPCQSSGSNTVPLSFDRPDCGLDFGGEEPEYEFYDPAAELAQCIHVENWYEELGDASGLDAPRNLD